MPTVPACMSASIRRVTVSFVVQASVANTRWLSLAYAIGWSMSVNVEIALIGFTTSNRR